MAKQCKHDNNVNVIELPTCEVVHAFRSGSHFDTDMRVEYTGKYLVECLSCGLSVRCTDPAKLPGWARKLVQHCEAAVKE